MTNPTSHDEGPRGRTGRNPLGQSLLFKVLPYAVGIAFWAASIVRLGWDPEIAWLLALFACGIAITLHVLLEWGALKMPTRVSIPGFLTGVFFMVGAATLRGDPDPRYIVALTGLWLITSMWWSRARELERLKRLRQQMM